MPVYRIPIYRVALVRDSSQPTTTQQILQPADAHEILATYLAGADRENFVILLLDIKHKVIGINTVGVGTLSGTLVHPREVFKPAILANAAAIIMAHNHPSGDPEPSPEDISVTKQIAEAGKVLCISVLDHIIVGDERFYSFQDHGLL